MQYNVLCAIHKKYARFIPLLRVFSESDHMEMGYIFLLEAEFKRSRGSSHKLDRIFSLTCNIFLFKSLEALAMLTRNWKRGAACFWFSSIFVFTRISSQTIGDYYSSGLSPSCVLSLIIIAFFLLMGYYYYYGLFLQLMKMNDIHFDTKMAISRHYWKTVFLF